MLATFADFLFDFNIFFNNLLIGFETMVALQAVEDHLNGMEKLIKNNI